VRISLVSFALAFASCGGGGENAPVDAATAADAAHPVDAAGPGDLAAPPDLALGCPRTPPPPDRARKVVVSHPFDDAGNQSSDYELLDLSAAGDLTVPGARFQMGHAPYGEVAFTPDGLVGLSVQDDGSIGVFRVDGNGMPQVVHAAFKGTFYATGIVMDPSGASAYVLDGNWRNNGGGVYQVGIACDGTLTDQGLITAAKLPYAMALTGGGAQALLVSDDVLAAPAGQFAYLLDWSNMPAFVAAANAFGDDQPIVSDAKLTHDGRFLLIADDSAFSGIPNRVAVVEVMPGALAARQVLTPFTDPAGIAVSPFDDTAVVSSAQGNALLIVDYDAARNPPFAVRGEVAYAGAKPELPVNGVVIGAGPLEGRALFAENLGVRQLAFAAGGVVTDLGKTATGTKSSAIVGAIGVQP
jgi:hypothetical protein